MMWWKTGIGIVIVGLLSWIGWTVTRPVPGTKIADLGRDHVSPEEVAKFTYNSNPPTSGPHLSMWVRAGVFDRAQREGELIHSLEHGYVIINYNCNVHLGENPKSEIRNPKQIQNSKFKIQNVFAHEEGSPSADFIDSTIATGSAVNESDGCKTLVKQLTGVANKKKLWKLIVVPRPPQSNAAGTFDVPQLDTTIALTAWTYIDKFDAFDTGRIERFIDFHRDQGPEKTME
ncbi:DUF3105 domain-containing protein [Candidatus Gottesmanbacteria bacterium]|nr:DUF3105 domain-containing protein [Candidatus Gottesmanbacteria bacterium]